VRRRRGNNRRFVRRSSFQVSAEYAGTKVVAGGRGMLIIRERRVFIACQYRPI